MTDYVLDAGAIISGYQKNCAFTTPEVVDEAVSKEAEGNVDALVTRGLVVRPPTNKARDRVLDVAQRTGDDSRLSQADVSVIALALDMSAVLVTDDYSIQNVARTMDIDFLPIEQDGIKEVWGWHWLCNKCRKEMEGPGECFICGGEAVKKRRK